ncbi:MAG: BspA family leucine-rich repeat surface protein [Ruminococcus sp.]|nr:BspA family leucine-rich repeat surface protein [Ruminococcus sp.]
MKYQLLKKSVAILFSLLTVSGNTSLSPVSWFFEEYSVLAYADEIHSTPYLDPQNNTILHLAGNVSNKEWSADDANDGIVLPNGVNKSQIQSIVADADTVLPSSCYCLFTHFQNVKSIDLSNADTTAVTDMHSMFDTCSKLDTLTLGDNFDTSSVTKMERMFADCKSLTTIEFGEKFVTSKVFGFGEMFQGCTNLIAIDLSRFDTQEALNMDGMFCDCSSLSILDLHSFNTKKVYSMSGLFSGCTNLKTIIVGKSWSVDRLINAWPYNNNIFVNCINLKGGLGTEYSWSNPFDQTYARIDGGTEKPGYFTDVQLYGKTRVEAKAPTCTETGNIEYYTDDKGNYYTYEDGELLSVDYESILIEQLPHQYTINWSWSDDYSSAVVTLSCNNCTDSQTADAEINMVEYRPNNEYEGQIIYTAIAVVDEKYYYDYKYVTIPKEEYHENAAAKLIEANTVSFKDNLSLNFLANIDDSLVDGAYVKFTYNHYGTEKVVTCPIDPADKNGDEYRFRCELTASEMAIDVKADLYLKDSTEPVSTWTRNIRDYCIAGLQHSTSDKEKALFRATLNYGGYTQKRFGYNGEPYANAGYEGSVDNVTVISEVDFVRPQGVVNGIEYTGASVFFRNAPYVRYYFKLADGNNIDDYTFKIGDTTIIPTAKNGEYYIESDPVLAYQLDNTQRIRVSKSNAGIFDFNFSIIKWAELAAVNSTDSAEKDMAKALYVYYLAAKHFVYRNSN